MTERRHLHQCARQIFGHALTAADARVAVRRSVQLENSVLHVAGNEFRLEDDCIYAIALGKAATSMAAGLTDSLGPHVTHGLVSGPTLNEQLLSTGRWKMFQGGHPLPNQQSLDAADAAFELFDLANRDQAVVLSLVSGGGSAMLEWPVSSDITLEDLQETNRQLVNCGATIAEINAVRRSISAVKGGRLARRAPNARIITLIVSDTNRGDEASVASGPTLSASANAPDALSVVEEYRLRSLPNSILNAIRNNTTIPTSNLRELPALYHVLLDNSVVVKAARQKAIELGFKTTVENDIVEQPIDEGSTLLLRSLDRQAEMPACWVSGGEFSCRPMGTGRGGRNLETVLRCAIELDQDRNKSRYHTVVLSAGTDGIDGSSTAAGAIADETTVARARLLGLDAHDCLQRSDSHAFFDRLGDLNVTGPTGTNVRDLRIVLRCKSTI